MARSTTPPADDAPRATDYIVLAPAAVDDRMRGQGDPQATWRTAGTVRARRPTEAIEQAVLDGVIPEAGSAVAVPARFWRVENYGVKTSKRVEFGAHAVLAPAEEPSA